jgi:glycosyltransferase involved in cell wall biosynthesis
MGAAITERGARHTYPADVRWRIAQDIPGSYAAAARALSRAGVAAIAVQHEFGLYGEWRPADEALVDMTPALLAAAERPLITTLHTVLPDPITEVRHALRRLCAGSAAVVVMARAAARLLAEVYGVDPARVRVIPHGVPVFACREEAVARAELGLSGRTVLSTFGLIHRNKGIEVAIRALPDIVARHPEVVYLVIGQTHPTDQRREGESYRDELDALVRDLGVAGNVRFVNRYLDQAEIPRYLEATDIYLTPYHDRTQISSGTLAYALGCGRAIVSTPYAYAVEALAEGRGLLAAFGDPTSIARCVLRYLDKPTFARAIRARALAYGQEMIWPRAGERYARLIEEVAGGTGGGLVADLSAAGRPPRGS